MKFVIATVFTLALAVGVQSSVLPWGHHLAAPVHLVTGAHAPAAIALHAGAVAHHGWDDGLWHGDWHDGAWHGGWDDGLWHGDVHDGAWHGDVHDGLWHNDLALAVHAPHHEGHYVAKTRGAIHKAPLAGHVASAAAINILPAPGTV